MDSLPCPPVHAGPEGEEWEAMKAEEVKEEMCAKEPRRDERLNGQHELWLGVDDCNSLEDVQLMGLVECSSCDGGIHRRDEEV